MTVAQVMKAQFLLLIGEIDLQQSRRLGATQFVQCRVQSIDYLKRIDVIFFYITFLLD